MPLIQLELASEQAQSKDEDLEMEDEAQLKQIVTPGDVITRDIGFMRGHGTYMKGDVLYASVAGVVQRVNKLISVCAARSKYQGEIGDVLVGRVVEVQQRKWRVDVNARLDAVLQLSAVNLPGGELRRRSAEDELAMRRYLQEGDLISAEVQNVHSDGTLALHTRSLKYGKLSQGTLVKVPPSLVKRRKTHFHRLPSGASVILGNNGYVWISPTQVEEDENGAGAGGFAQNLGEVSKQDREIICRLRNCILALAASKIMLWDTTITNAFDISSRFHLTELLKSDVMAEIAEETRQRMEMGH